MLTYREAMAEIRRLNRALEDEEVSEAHYVRRMTVLLRCIPPARLAIAQNLSYYPCQGPTCRLPGARYD